MEAVRQTLSFSIINILGTNQRSCSDGVSCETSPQPTSSSSSVSELEERISLSPAASLSDHSTPYNHLKQNQQNTSLETGVMDNMSDDISASDSEAELYVVNKTHTKRPGRMRFTPAQIQTLEKKFLNQHYLLPADRKYLAKSLHMTERQVKTWFQNKRAQYKRTRPLVRNPVYHYPSSPTPLTLSLPHVHLLQTGQFGINIQLPSLAGIAGHPTLQQQITPLPPTTPLPPVTLSALSPHLPMPMAYIPVPIAPPK